MKDDIIRFFRMMELRSSSIFQDADTLRQV